MSPNPPDASGQEESPNTSPARTAADSEVGFVAVLADTEFRALWLARLLSLAGDQVTRVALSVLVFARTGSASITALSYAMTFLPWVIGGPLLSGLADRWPRRFVMLAADLLRGLLILGAGLCASASVPLAVPIVLIFVAEFCAPAFEAARAALIPTILTGDRYVVGSALGSVTMQAGQVLGFAAGGALVATLGARRGLMLDALTFVASAAMIRRSVHERPAALGGSIVLGSDDVSGLADGDRDATASWWSDLVAGCRLIVVDPFLRTLVLLAGLCVFLVVPEALAVPVATASHDGAQAVGVLLAAMPAGTVIGGLALARLVPSDRRTRWIAPLAICAGLPLVLCSIRPGLVLTVLLWAVCGLLMAYNLPANTDFAVAVPDRHRGQAIGVVQTGLAVGQGLGLVIAGALADRFAPLDVIAGAGLLSCVLAVIVVLTGTTKPKAPLHLPTVAVEPDSPG